MNRKYFYMSVEPLSRDVFVKKSVVALIRCESYEPLELDRAIRKGIDILGGVEKFAAKGENILFKPNILNGSNPDKCVVTHPNVLGAAARIFAPTGAKLSYGDSPCVESTEVAAKKAGFEAAASRENLPLVDFSQSVPYSFREASFYGSFPLARAVTTSDGLISLCKLKTHNFTRITGAVKNQYGCIPGLHKARYHARFPMIQEFSRFIVDVCAAAKVRLYIMDAVWAMEGDGPNNGTPRKLGLILMSSDPVALDATACRIVDLDPLMVPTNKAGAKAGLGTYESKDIVIAGERLEECMDKEFSVVRKPPFSVYGHGLRRKLQVLLVPKPVLSKTRCIKCGRCIDICPVEPKALQWKDNKRKTQPSHIDSRCIRCFCCQEACPANAVSIKTSLPGIVLPEIIHFMFPIVRRGLHLVRRFKKNKTVES